MLMLSYSQVSLDFWFVGAFCAQCLGRGNIWLSWYTVCEWVSRSCLQSSLFRICIKFRAIEIYLSMVQWWFIEFILPSYYMFLHLLTTWDFENQLCCADLERPGHNNNGLPWITYNLPLAEATTATPQKCNIPPEKWWLEYKFPFGMVYFQGLC